MGIFNSTLDNGGGTFNFPDLSPYEGKGYVVGIKDGSFAITRKDSSGEFFGSLLGLMTAIADGEFPEQTRIGTWVNGDDIHIDPVVVVQDRVAAVLIGKAYNQLAVFNLWDMEEITL